MAEPKRTDLSLRAERAVLAQVILPRAPYDADETLEELESLARTAGAVVLGHVRQKREKFDPRRYLGKGKLEELQALCQAVEADVVITDDELSPSQVRTLEAALDVKVVDRSEVILDIFAAHANTVQAQLQVELAQLEYEFPRLKRLWTHLDRTAGGTVGGPVGGIGVRGPGERQLEVDRRLVQRRIQDLKRKLQTIEARRQTMVSGRTERFCSVALVGYTNAGKSSLMNALTGAGVSVADRLFETLDTRTRQWELPDGPPVLLSDTVGFVRKFPHHLAASFHATLAEAHEADLLMHVIDASCHESEQEIQAVNEALKEVDCDKKPTLYVLNKVDLVDDLSDLPLLRKLVGDVVCTSAVTGAGLDELRQRVICRLKSEEAEFRVQAAAGDGRLIAFVHQKAHVLDEVYADATVEMRVRMAPALAGVIRSMGGRVEEEAADARRDGAPA
jgi:GTP-binding protein HflX